jgi:hypothetical protein
MMPKANRLMWLLCDPVLGIMITQRSVGTIMTDMAATIRHVVNGLE